MRLLRARTASLLLAAAMTCLSAPAPAQDGMPSPFLVQRFGMSGAFGNFDGLFRENYVMAVMMEFRRSAGEDQVLDAADIERIRSVADAGYRAKIVGKIMSNDLNADGIVEGGEIRQTGITSAARVDAGALLKGYLVADGNGDGRITAEEAVAYAKARPVEFRADGRVSSATAEQMLALDPNGDSSLSGNELENVARAAFARFDGDGNGVLTEREAEPLMRAAREMRAAEQAGGMRPAGCTFPQASGQAKLVYVGGYESGTLSTVSVAGQDQETETVEISIQPGKAPLYILATSFTPMIWRLSGDTWRVERFVTAGRGRPGEAPGVGVAGLARDKVDFIPQRCLLPVYDRNPGSEAGVRWMVKRSLGRFPDEVLNSYTLRLPGRLGSSRREAEALGASADLRFVPHAPRSFTTYPATVDRDTYDSLVRFSPGGYAVLDPGKVVSPGKVEVYQVMPQQAGLLQLMEQGRLERMGRAYRIVKPIPRFPPGLNGAHLVDFVLASGVPMPAGDPGHSTLRSEETGEMLIDVGQRRQPRTFDPFADVF